MHWKQIEKKAEELEENAEMKILPEELGIHLTDPLPRASEDQKGPQTYGEEIAAESLLNHLCGKLGSGARRRLELAR